jgi:hypothetical protein
MKLTIFGATGATGRCLTEQAIAAGTTSRRVREQVHSGTAAGV